MEAKCNEVAEIRPAHRDELEVIKEQILANPHPNHGIAILNYLQDIINGEV